MEIKAYKNTYMNVKTFKEIAKVTDKIEFNVGEIVDSEFDFGDKGQFLKTLHIVNESLGDYFYTLNATTQYRLLNNNVDLDKIRKVTIGLEVVNFGTYGKKEILTIFNVEF